MQVKRKGGNAPKRTKPQTHPHNIKVYDICLALLWIGIVLMIAGFTADRSEVAWLGIGMAFSNLITMYDYYESEDNENE